MDKYGMLVFTIEDTNTYYANSLRRTMISDVPTLAIDTVNVFDNTSILTDEILVHRLGLIVLNSSIIDIGDITMELDAACDEEEMYVTASMLKCNNSKIYAVNPGTIILKLYKGQKINLKCVIKKGIGRDHAKWMPVAAIGYNISQKGDGLKIILSIEPVGSLSGETILSQAKDIMKTRTEIKCLNKFKKRYLR